MYLFTNVSGEMHSLYADSGESLKLVESSAMRSAGQFIKNNPGLISKGYAEHNGLIEMDLKLK